MAGTTLSNKLVRFGAVEFQAALKSAGTRSDVEIHRAHQYGEGQYERITRKDLGAITGETVTNDTAVKGVWIDEDTFRPLTPEALAAIKALGEAETVEVKEGRKTVEIVKDLTAIEIDEFVPLAEVPFERAEGGYYLAPGKGGIGSRPMKLLYEALRAEKSAGVFKFVLKGGGRQKLGVIWPKDGRLLVTVLGFAGDYAVSDEVREAMESMAKPEKAYLDMMRAFVKAKATSADESLLATARDTAVDAKAEGLEQALNGETPEAPKRAARQAAADAKVDDLLAKLTASVEALAA